MAQDYHSRVQIRVNWYRIGAVGCGVVTLYFLIGAIRLWTVMNSWVGPFLGSNATAALMICLVCTGGFGWGTWALWKEGGKPHFYPRSRVGPTEPRPSSPQPGWYQDPWRPSGGRWWDGTQWTKHCR